MEAGLLVTRAQLELTTGEFQAALKTAGRLLAGPQAGIHYQYRLNCVSLCWSVPSFRGMIYWKELFLAISILTGCNVDCGDPPGPGGEGRGAVQPVLVRAGAAVLAAGGAGLPCRGPPPVPGGGGALPAEYRHHSTLPVLHSELHWRAPAAVCECVIERNLVSRDCWVGVEAVVKLQAVSRHLGSGQFPAGQVSWAAKQLSCRL